MSNSLLLNSIKMEQNISKAHKIQVASFFKDLNSSVAMDHFVMNHYKICETAFCLSKNNQDLHHRTPSVQDQLVY